MEVSEIIHKDCRIEARDDQLTCVEIPVTSYYQHLTSLRFLGVAPLNLARARLPRLHISRRPHHRDRLASRLGSGFAVSRPSCQSWVQSEFLRVVVARKRSRL
jgi:hypothetical protein